MNDEQRLLISAYHDGQADPRASAAARALIDADAEARAYWRDLQRIDRMLGDAFNPVADQGVPAHMQRLVRGGRRRSWVQQLAPLALAASLALVVVLLVREDSLNSQMHDELAQMRQQIAALRNQTLENLPSGSAGAWAAPAGSARAQITPLQTYRTADNRFCRAYEERVEGADGVEVRRGIACRVGKRDWSDVGQQPSLPPAAKAGVDAVRF